MEYYQEIKWHDHARHITNTQKNIYLTSAYSDVIICAGEKRARAHRLVLSLCSDLLYNIFKEYPITETATIILPSDLNSQVVDSLISFMYTGEVFLENDLLGEFLHACKLLKLKGSIQINDHDSTMEYSMEDATSPLQSDKLDTYDSQIIMQEEYIVENQNDDGVENADESFIESLITVAPTTVPDDDQSNAIDYQSCYDIDDTGCVEEKYEIDNESGGEFEEFDEMEEFDVELTTDNSGIPDQNENDWKKKPARYSETALLEAFNDLANGATIMDTSVKYNIPRSTLYCKIRSNTKYSYLYRSIRESAIKEATNAVVYNKLSLQQAASQFGISKTVLWRKLRQSSEYKPEDRSHACREQAIKAIEDGEKLLNVSKKYKIPISTLHRDKIKLLEQGRLPKHCTVVKREVGPEFKKRIEAALESCRNGMTQKMASQLHNVPKTTIWRYMNSKTGKN
ncbi:hypothetical protein HA402_009013 [Bradysia odoriphaga]|nr:hypothetical protein HA402_009013 [Bradysia odoriphaga]